MNNKKIIQLLITVIAAVWVFCIVFMISYKAESAKQSKNTTTAPILTNPTTTSEAPTSTTQYSVPSITIDGNNVTVSADVDKPQWLIDEEESKKAAEESKKASEAAKNTTTTKSYVPSGKEEIISEYIKAVNKLKNTETFTVTKTNTMHSSIDDITGGSTIKQVAEKVIAQNNPNGTTTYNFKNGMDNTTGYSPNQIIAPKDTAAALDAQYVKSATATEGKNGTYNVKIELQNSTQTLDTTASIASVMDIIDFDSLGLTSTMTITSLSVNYFNAYIEAVIDKNGNILSMTHYTDCEGSGEGKVTFVPASMSMHGDYSATYTISY